MGKAGNIAIRTAKPSYVAGDMVSGEIQVSADHAIPCNAITLRIKGYQKAEWDYLHAEHKDDGTIEWEKKDREAKQEYFKDWIPVYTPADGVIPEGTHTYPFQYQLPADLPGVFEEEGKQGVRDSDGDMLKYKGKVLYKVKAVVDVPGTDKGDIKSTQKLVVFEKLPNDIKPANVTKTGTVFACCCIPRGSLTLNAYFDQNHYQVGQEVNVYVKCDNESSRDIPKLKLKLMRILQLRDKHGHSHTSTTEVVRGEYEGVPAGEKVERQMSIPVARDVPPSTDARFVSNVYRLDVEADVPMAADIEAQLMMKLFCPQPTEWGTFLAV